MRSGRARAGACGAALVVLVVSAAPSSAYLRPGDTTRVSVSSAEQQAVDPEFSPIGSSSWDTAISGNGRFVAFESSASNLVPGDLNGVEDIFVRDLVKGKTEIVSVASNGAIAQMGLGACPSGVYGALGSHDPSISADGRYVAFHSCATNLVADDTNLVSDVFVRDRVKGTTSRVSVASGGKQIGGITVGSSMGGNMSPDGRYVGFSSDVADVVPKDSNGEMDAFMYDRQTRKTILVSLGDQGQQGNGGSGCPAFDWGARYVTFTSSATNLVPGDEDGFFADGFVRDLKTKKTRQITVAGGANVPFLGGGAGTCHIAGQSMSADGRYILIQGNHSGFVPADDNGRFDVFVYDQQTRRIDRVSVNSSGEEGARDAGTGGISLNGRFLTFWSDVPFFPQDTGTIPENRIPPDSAGDSDVFVYDLKTKALDWVSLNDANQQAEGCGVGTLDGTSYAISKYSVISRDGRFVAFESCATNLVPGDTNAAPDTFVRDRGPALGIGTLRAAGPDGTIALAPAATARNGIATIPDADDDLGGRLGGAEIVEARLIHRPALGDLMAWIDLADAPVASPERGELGAPLTVYGMSFVVGGVRYELRASAVDVDPLAPVPLGPGFGLFRCPASEALNRCDRIARLRGGYGTTGETVAITVPLAAVGLDRGGKLSDLRAFTGLGSMDLGARETLDVARPPAR